MYQVDSVLHHPIKGGGLNSENEQFNSELKYLHYQK
jgi:hypothetical protein